MTQEEKDLLLTDLSARVRYGVKFRYHMEGDNSHKEGFYVATIDSIGDDTVEFTYEEEGGWIRDWSCPIQEVRPFLRPLSDITEEEKKELDKYYLCIIVGNHITLKYHSEGYWDHDTEVEFKDYLWLEDWLNSHYFDYRGLIEMDLAEKVGKEKYKERYD